MKVGVTIIQEDMKFSDILSATLHAEKLGYDSVWIADHLYFTSIDKDFLEGWTLLTALAMKTEAIRLGTLVLCDAFRHPSIVGKASVTLDVISGGRLNFGIGAGWHEKEFKKYGIPFIPYNERVAKLEMDVRMIKNIWEEMLPKPIQDSIPIWIGGMGKRILRVVAKHGDACNFSRFDISPEDCENKLSYLEKRCKIEGRDYSKIEKSVCFSYKGMKSSPIGMLLTKKRIGQAMRDPKLALKFVSQRLFGAQTPQRVLSENNKECLQKLKEYKDAGVTYFIVEFLNSDDLIKFGKEILPEVRRW